ncbi:MAG: CHRD domain-containing protein [Verrucomicrobiota bacterium]|nr:CHRD domain-containing protein [Verrucomicrobiota bacterium]
MANTQAQGTLQFTVNLNGANEVPPNSSSATGWGTLTLEGTSLNYDIGVSYLQGGSIPSDGTINAWVNLGNGNHGSFLIDLGAPTFFPPPPNPTSGYYPFGWVGGITNVTTGEITDLEAGLWHVNVFSSSGAYPNGGIRGQILPVPEPSTFALFGLSALTALRWSRRAVRRRCLNES